MQVMSNLLYFCGMCGVVKEMLLKRYFSKVYLCFQKHSLFLLPLRKAETFNFIYGDRTLEVVLNSRNQIELKHAKRLANIILFLDRDWVITDSWLFEAEHYLSESDLIFSDSCWMRGRV